MAQCHNCGHEIRAGSKFCPECGQDQSVVVPQDQRIPTENVPVPPLPADSRQGSTSRSRNLVIGLVGCGGLLGLLIVALVVVAIVSGPQSETAQSGGGKDNGEEKKKSSTAKTNAQA